MLKPWHFNVLFFVGVGGAVFLLVGPNLGLSVEDSPLATGGVGAILAFILSQRKALTKNEDKGDKEGGE